MAGIDGYTKLMLHCDGTDASTSFPDDSASSHTVTANGTAQVDTAQKVFGTASLLLDGNSDYLSISHSDDFNFDSGDFTVDCRIRFNSTSGAQVIMGRNGSSDRSWALYYNSGNLRFAFYTSTTNDVAFSWTPSVDTWYHIAVVRNGADLKVFVDGTQIGTTYNISTNSIRDAISSDFYIGENVEQTGYYFNGWLDEIRISKGIARWTANFTSPTEAYSGDETLDFDETVNVDDTWQIQSNPEQSSLDENVNVNDTWNIQSNPEQVSIDDTITVSDSWSIQEFEKADYATKIISANSLIFVTDTNPAKILHVDISTPTSPVVTGAILSNVSNATDVSYNSNTDYIYVSCADGKVVKVDINDLESQTIISLSEVDNLDTIETFSAESLTYTTTPDSTGELHMIDEREVFSIDTDFQFLSDELYSIDTQFDFIEGFFLDTDFQYLQTNTFQLNTDFKWLANTFDSITPYSRTDFHVYIDDVELASDDLILSSISITHTIDEESTAIFNVARKHDAINSPLNGGTVELTNQNDVKIYIGSNLEFHGKVSNLNCIYSDNNDMIEVSATMTQPSDNRQKVALSLPSIDDSLGLYDILVQNPQIYNPYVDPNDDNPEVYKGVRVNLGKRTTQTVSRYRFIETIINNKGSIATDIENGDFEFKQNWEYFWLATARNIITNKQWYVNRYIGTSLSSLTSDTWEMIGTPYYRQRVRENTVEDLGEYTVGSAPYLDVSVSNGELRTVKKYVDKDDGLYSEKDESYNYVGKLQASGDSYVTVEKGYAQKVADLEYSKLLTINGQVLPITNANMQLTIDAYYYYNLKLLTRVNIDNTTTANIFNNNNGFPISIKSLTISSDSMRININASNQQSLTELQEIDDTYPDENSEEYLFPLTSTRISRKYDPSTDSYVE